MLSTQRKVYFRDRIKNRMLYNALQSSEWYLHCSSDAHLGGWRIFASVVVPNKTAKQLYDYSAADTR